MKTYRHLQRQRKVEMQRERNRCNLERTIQREKQKER